MEQLDGYSSFRAISPSDSERVSCRALYVNAAGTLALSVDASATSVSFNVAAGQLLPVNLAQGRVMSTGTTATGIIALG